MYTQFMNDLKALSLASCTELISEVSSKQWLSDQVNNLSARGNFFIAFGMAPKKVGKHSISLSGKLMQTLSAINASAIHINWSLDELARLTLLLHLPIDGRHETITKLLVTSDIREQKLIYKSLQYLQQPEDFELQMIDGIRTNMTDVFDAISLRSSYPLRYFKEAAWNQMVLKAIFMERPIYQIEGLDERRNADLARIAIDFAHERQSAGRKVTPELWRLVAPFVDDTILPDLIKVTQSTDLLEREAGIRALSESGLQDANTWLMKEHIETDTRSWDAIGQAIFNSN